MRRHPFPPTGSFDGHICEEDDIFDRLPTNIKSYPTGFLAAVVSPPQEYTCLWHGITGERGTCYIQKSRHRSAEAGLYFLVFRATSAKVP